MWITILNSQLPSLFIHIPSYASKSKPRKIIQSVNPWENLPARKENLNNVTRIKSLHLLSFEYLYLLSSLQVIKILGSINFKGAIPIKLLYLYYLIQRMASLKTSLEAIKITVHPWTHKYIRLNNLHKWVSNLPLGA